MVSVTCFLFSGGSGILSGGLECFPGSQVVSLEGIELEYDCLEVREMFSCLVRFRGRGGSFRTFQEVLGGV